MDQTGTQGPRVAVVLGAAVRRDGRASAALRRRALHGAQLWQAGQVDCLLLCGGQVRGPVSEASVAARLCAEAGVPGHLLHLEDQSRDTLENLHNARPLLAQLSAGEVVLVTDPAHARRARLVARRLGIEARSACPEAPVRLRALLREALARLWYRWRLRGLS